MNKELLNNIGKIIQGNVSSIKVSELKKMTGLELCEETEYDKLTIIEYLTYYKIDRTYELGLISKEKKIELESRYRTYVELYKIIVSELDKQRTIKGYESDSINGLIMIAKGIRESLVKDKVIYDGYLELSSIMDKIILDESINGDYISKPIEKKLC